MSAAMQPPGPMTTAEFLKWNPGDGRRWQLVDGELHMMAPSSPVHALLHMNLGAALHSHLRAKRSGCRVFAEAGIVPRILGANNVRIPDLTVSCTGIQTDQAVLTDPILLIEILSPSNRADTWMNVWAYTSIPSVQEILVLRSTSIGADLLRRDAGGEWPEKPMVITEGHLRLDSIGFAIELSDLYADTPLVPG